MDTQHKITETHAQHNKLHLSKNANLVLLESFLLIFQVDNSKIQFQQYHQILKNLIKANMLLQAQVCIKIHIIMLDQLALKVKLANFTLFSTVVNKLLKIFKLNMLKKLSITNQLKLITLLSFILKLKKAILLHQTLTDALIGGDMLIQSEKKEIM